MARANRPLPSREYLLKLLNYNPETGALTWRERDASGFAGHLKPGRIQSWNTQWSGKPALAYVSEADGYRRGTIHNVFYLAHRVIWKMLYDEEPDQIDHDNGKRSDNSQRNLKATTSAGNAKNKALVGNNTSGYCGVSWDRQKRKWRAYYTQKDRQHFLGYFGTAEEANAARLIANRKNGFSLRHGARG